MLQIFVFCIFDNIYEANSTLLFQAKRLITNEFAAIKVIKLEPGMTFTYHRA